LKMSFHYCLANLRQKTLSLHQISLLAELLKKQSLQN
jgi:hypothetical protein